MADKPERLNMPIMGSVLMSKIPFAMLIPHEAQARRNHGQSLDQLAERGGLSVGEAIAIIDGLRWGTVKDGAENARYLINKVRGWHALPLQAAEPKNG